MTVNILQLPTVTDRIVCHCLSLKTNGKDKGEEVAPSMSSHCDGTLQLELQGW